MTVGYDYRSSYIVNTVVFVNLINEKKFTVLYNNRQYPTVVVCLSLEKLSLCCY